MSALGHKQTYAVQQPMSALLPTATAKADICGALDHVCFAPKADILNGVDRRVETEMEQFGSGLVAGISVPNTPIIAEALDYAQRLSEPYLFNHAVRSWLFAISIARAKNIDYDSDVVAIGTILHDIGLTNSVTGPKRFEVNGADAARAFVVERGLSDRRAQLIWDLVALNSTTSIALYKEPEVAVGTMGIGLDWGGFGIGAIPTSEMADIVNAFPRLKMKEKFAQACCHVIQKRPETSSDNFLRDFGERFVPGYKVVSAVDLLMSAPFEE
jgi:hypothetical protein